MSISAEYAPVKVSGNATAGPFSFTFKVFDEDDLLVQTIVKTTDVATTKTRGTHYTVALSTTSDGGTITFTSGNYPASTEWVFIASAIANTQPTSFPLGGNLREDNVENALDRLLRLIQQLVYDSGKKFGFDISEDDDAPTVPALVADRYLYTDGTDLSWEELATTTTEFNGTISRGLDSAKPASPSTGDIYFATDTNILYKCIGSNTWNHHYIINNLTVSGTSAFTGNVTMAGTLTVAGLITATTDVTIGDDITVTDDLIVNGDIDLEGNMDINGTLETDAITLAGAAIDAASGLVTQTSGGLVNGKRIGTRAAKSADTAYLAEADGTIEASLEANGSVTMTVSIKVDGSNPPTTEVASTVLAVASGNNIFTSARVKKGEYYKVDTTSENSSIINWVPEGT